MERSGQLTDATYTIRLATESDLLGLVRLHHDHEGPPGMPAPTEPSERQRRTWDQMMANPAMHVYIALRGDAIVGNTCMTLVANLINDCRPVAFVEPMLVAAAHRRHGVGRLMVERLVADARAADVCKIQLLSHKRHAHDGAHAFYRSLGFEPEAEGFRRYLPPSHPLTSVT